jgi:phosphoglycerate dehydrogenase-like enzyme
MSKRSIDAILITNHYILNDPHFKTYGMEEIRKAAPNAEVVIIQNEDEWQPHRADLSSKVGVIVGHRPPAWLKELPNLRWMQLVSAGANWLPDSPDVIQSDLILTNVGMRAIPIAEHIFALMLTLSRCIQYSVRRQINHNWDKWIHREDMTELNGATMGIIGVGKIGEETAKIAKGMNMKVLGLRRHPERAVPHVDKMYGPSGLSELLAESDWVVLTAALTSETKWMIGEAELKAMKKSAHIINVGRGPLIKETDLIKALQEGWITGAGLDVVEQEPHPEDSPLWDMENVVITPHNSGTTPYAVDRFIKLFIDNLKRYQAGEPLMNVLDKRLGY